MDHSEAVDGPDTTLIRNLLLGFNNDFPGNTSWRFIDAAFVFPNPNNPFETSFPESIILNNITENVSNVDFKAVKIGDINKSASPILEIDPCDISCGHISGNVFHDLNENCLFDNLEEPFKYKLNSIIF